jgi:outer membrane protein assembly factor BamB
MLWSLPRKDHWTSSLLYMGGLYLGNEQGKIVKVQCATGKVIWEQESTGKQEGIYTLLVHK